MNSVGQMWRAFDLMVERACAREVHGGLLKDKQFIQGFIADSYIDIQAARLMTIHAAEKIDQDDGSARTDISAIKVFVPAAYSRVVDRAIQVWGAAGVSNDLPLAAHVPGGTHPATRRRPRRGPQDPHRQERRAPLQETGESWDFGNWRGRRVEGRCRRVASAGGLEEHDALPRAEIDGLADSKSRPVPARCLWRPVGAVFELGDLGRRNRRSSGRPWCESPDATPRLRRGQARAVIARSQVRATDAEAPPRP